MALKIYGEIIPKELMFQRFTSVFDGYTLFYVIMYSISMDSAYKPFHCKAAADYFFSSLGASVLWLPCLWCFLNRFSFIWDIGIKSVDTVVFRRAWKKLNGKREKYNIGLKRGVFIAILRCLFQRDICASFNRFCCKVASWWSRLGFRYFELVRGNWQGFLSCANFLFLMGCLSVRKNAESDLFFLGFC